MTLEEFKKQVEYEYLMTDGEPEATMTVRFPFDYTYELTLIVGEDGVVVIIICINSTIELSQESVFAYCLFDEQAKKKGI